MALGADSVETDWRLADSSRFHIGSLLGGFDDLVRPQAARADAQPPHATVHERPHPLKVGLEPSRSDVVRVADVATHDRAFSAEFAAFCHDR